MRVSLKTKKSKRVKVMVDNLLHITRVISKAKVRLKVTKPQSLKDLIQGKVFR